MSKGKNKDIIQIVKNEDIKQDYNNDLVYITNCIQDKVKEYKNILNEDDNISNSMLYDTNCFNGLLSYIGDNLFSKNKYIHNTFTVPYDDFMYLDRLHKTYKLLCGLYKQKIYLLGFCTFLSIPHSTISMWLSGSKRLTPVEVDIIKSWCDVSELSQVADNSVKSIFLLKSQYNYSEEPQQTQTSTTSTAQLPAADGYLLADK